MDIIELIARSEWPVVVGGSIYILRHQLKSLIDRVNVTKIDAWGLKAEFEKSLDKAETLAPPMADETKAGARPKIEDRSATAGDIVGKGERIMIDLGGRMMPSPETLILESWNKFEKELLEAAGVDGRAEAYRVTKIIAREVDLSDQDMQAFSIMHDLRNKVAHSSAPFATWEDVRRFQDVLNGIMQRVRAHYAQHSK